MKTKLFTLLLIFASIAYEASAYKIIIRGGTGRLTYYQIIIDDNMMSCTGRGPNHCPAIWSNNDGQTKVGGVPMGDITKYVLDQTNSGRPEGQVNFENRLPCSWKTVGENVEIDIKSNDVTGLPKHD